MISDAKWKNEARNFAAAELNESVVTQQRYRGSAMRTAAVFVVIIADLAIIATCPSSASGQGGGVALPSPYAGVKGTKTLKQTSKAGLRSEIGCKGGLQHGRHVVWHKNGTKIYEGEYRNGFQIKTHRSWHPDGKPASVDEYGPPAPPGAQIRQTVWNTAGKLNFYAEWAHDGEPVYQVALDEKGERILELGVPESPPRDLPEFGDLVPEPILKIAKNHVITQVGRTYFGANYRFLESASLYSRSGNNEKQYRVAFEYAPLKKLGDRGIVTAVVYSSGKTVRPYGYVATVRNDEVVEPTVTRAQALRILRRKTTFELKKAFVRIDTPGGLNPKLKTFSWAISIPLKPKNGRTGIVTHFVDAVSGKIIQ